MARKSLMSVTPGSGNVFADIGVAEPEEELARRSLPAEFAKSSGAVA